MNHLQDTQEMLREKVGRNEIGQYVSDKVDKDELPEHLPDMEGFELKLKDIIREEVQQLKNNTYENIRQIDFKMVALRKELDVENINRIISKKADLSFVNTELNGFEFKVSTLDRNLICIAQDFETFQKAINRMHMILVTL